MTKTELEKTVSIDENDTEKIVANEKLEQKRATRAKKKVESKEKIPAGENDRFEFTYTEFACDQQRTEVLTGEGKRFDNDVLLEILGFEKDAKGILRLQTQEHQVDRKANGEKVRIQGSKKITNKDINKITSFEDKKKEKKKQELQEYDRGA